MTLPAPYYADEHVQLFHGDCLTLLPHVGAVDHVITDPPYLLDFSKCMSAGRGDNFIAPRTIDYAPFTEADAMALGAALAPLPRRWCLVWSDAESGHIWRSALAPLRFIRTGAWFRTNACPQFTGDRPGTGFEIVTICHGGPRGRMRWNGGGKPARWDHAQRHGTTGGIANEHPTPKPLDLMRALVRDFTDPGDLILDPFAGSGTTGLAARLEGRRAILIEREERYCEVAARRLQHMPSETARGQQALFAGGER